MGRILRNLDIDGGKKRAVFDTGSTTSFINKDVLPECAVCIKVNDIDVVMGGKRQITNKRCFIQGKLEDIPFEFDAFVIGDIGDLNEKGETHHLDVLIGATTMEEWNIGLNPKKQELNLTGLKKREFLAV